MLDIKFIRENVKQVKEAVKNKNIKVDIDSLLSLDERRRALQMKVDSLRASRNELAQAGKGSKPTIEQIAKGKKIKEEVVEMEKEFTKVEVDYLEMLEKVPNVMHPDVPIGQDDNDNREVEIVGAPPQFKFEAKDHLQLGKDLDLLDFETAAKVSGSGFFYVKNELVFLELALIQYTFDKLATKGFKPFITPDIARSFAMKGTGYNPRGNEDQIYEIAGEDSSLIATAEITLGSYLANQVIDEQKLPIKYVGLSHCFRKESGAYGKESRGLYRVHQFSKVEMFLFSTPEQSNDLLEEMKNIEKEIYIELGIPFRVLDICSGDLGSPAYKKYDLEAWMPMKNDWGEITSCSNCTDYQARRLNIKYKNRNGASNFLHTLNGTAITTSRTPLAILENYQQADGSVLIPEVLQKYMPGNMKKISAKL